MRILEHVGMCDPEFTEDRNLQSKGCRKVQKDNAGRVHPHACRISQPAGMMDPPWFFMVASKCTDKYNLQTQNESVVDVFNPTLETRAPQSQPQGCIGTNGRDSGRGLGAGQSLLAAVADHSPKRARVRGASSADETAAEIETCSEELNDSCSWLSLGIAVDLQVILSATSMGKNGLSDVSEIDLHVLRPVKASLVFGSSLYRLLQAGATSFKQVERLNAHLEVQKARWMLEDAIALRKISLFGDIEDETDASHTTGYTAFSKPSVDTMHLDWMES
ncbi:hypothetical protein HDU82_004633 [Entophlyctis luteolus]|nr:hypothetical protein HDU82_004633 [Entophlyctis luteolus]